MNELRQILLSDRPLLITPGGYLQMIAAAFPEAALPALLTLSFTDAEKAPGCALPTSLFFGDEKTYREEQHEALERLCQQLRQEGDNPIALTDDYASEELPEGSVAYHPVMGIITADSRWYFSSKQLERDLQAAEQNPSIAAHFLHVNSPGGEAYYLDRLSETLDACQKPIVALSEMCCSAAYHIACHAQLLYATTRFDFMGCIGTMTSFYDWEPYYEKMGIRKVEARADNSDLKNKMFDDLVDGKPRQYVEQVLNPLNADFLSCIRAHREQLAGVKDDAPVMRGETYMTADAIQLGLCDGIRQIGQAVAECARLGREQAERQRLQESIYNMV